MALELQAVVALDHRRYSRGLGTLRNLTRNVTGAMSMAFGGVAGEIFTMTRAFGPLGGAIAGLKKAIEIGQDFQQSMANVASVTGLVGDELEAVGKGARLVAMETSFTATEAADALYALGSAGLSTASALNNSLVPALQLAGATQSDTRTATELMTAMLAAFRLETTKASAVADLFAGAVAASPANMERLAEAMTAAAPVAAAFGMSIGQTTTSIAAFHAVGIKASLAGTSFRQAMIALNKAAQDSESAIGRALQGWMPATEGLTGAIRRLEAAGITAQDAMTEFGIRGGKAVAAQLALGSAAIDALGAKIKTNSDVAKMYAIQMNTVQSQWKVLISLLQETGLRIWDKIKAGVMAMITAFQTAVKWVMALMQAFEEGAGLELFIAGLERARTVLFTVITNMLDQLSGINWRAAFDRLARAASTWIDRVDWPALTTRIVGGLLQLLIGALRVVVDWLVSDGALVLMRSLSEMFGSVLRTIPGLIITHWPAIAVALSDLIGSIAHALGAMLNSLLAGLFGNRNYMDMIAHQVAIWMMVIKLKIQEARSGIVQSVHHMMLAIIEKMASGAAKLAEILNLDAMAEKIRRGVLNIGGYYDGLNAKNVVLADQTRAVIQLMEKDMAQFAESSRKPMQELGDNLGGAVKPLEELLGKNQEVNKSLGTGMADAAATARLALAEMMASGTNAGDAIKKSMEGASDSITKAAQTSQTLGDILNAEVARRRRVLQGQVADIRASMEREMVRMAQQALRAPGEEVKVFAAGAGTTAAAAAGMAGAIGAQRPILERIAKASETFAGMKGMVWA